MGRRIRNYLKYLAGLDVSELSAGELKRIREEMLVQIGFFQHERFIHLVVTVTFAMLTVISLFAAFFGDQISLFALPLLLMVLLVPYINHYYLLENSVQKMYEYYDLVVQAIYGRDKTVFINEKKEK